MGKALGLAAVVAALLAAPGAHAQAPAVKGRFAAGPAISGKRVLWGERRSSAKPLLRTGRPGRGARTLFRPPVGTLVGNGPIDFTDLTASAGAVGLTLTRFEPAGPPSESFAGPAGGPFTALGFDDCVSPRLATDGSRLAYIESNYFCESSPTPAARLVIRELPGGPETSVPLDPTAGNLLELAGPYAAHGNVMPDGPITVLDTRNGAVVYQVPDAAFAFFSLQADGTLAVGSSRPVPGSSPPRFPIAWYSPAEPFAHPLGTARTPDVRLAGGRVAHVRHFRRGRVGLHLTRLTGGSTRVAVLRRVRPFAFPFDFDGTRVAWIDRKLERRRRGGKVRKVRGPVRVYLRRVGEGG